MKWATQSISYGFVKSGQKFWRSRTFVRNCDAQTNEVMRPCLHYTVFVLSVRTDRERGIVKQKADRCGQGEGGG